MPAIILIIILGILGICMLCFPEMLWKIENFLWVKNGEPTDLYIALMRIGGVVFIICAIAAAIFLF